MKSHPKLGFARFLAILFLLQSCQVYHRQTSTFEEAAKSDTRVLMLRNNGKKVKLHRVIYKDSAYSGVAKVHGRKVTMPLDPKDIKSLRIKNVPVSILGTVGLVVLGLAVLTVVIFAIDMAGGKL
jgi:hypothetical protein